MATTLGSKAVGSIVKLKVNNTLRNFIVVHQGKPSTLYDNSCNGTWLLMEDCYEQRAWHSSNVNDYAGSTIHTYLNGTFLNLFEANMRNAIKQVKIPYRPGSGTSTTINSGANGLSCKIFLLSGCELGCTTTDKEYFPADGAKLSYFLSGTGTDANNKRIAKFNGSAVDWWLRSPRLSNSTNAWFVRYNGNADSVNCYATYGVRPALVLPSDLPVSDDGSVSTNTAPTMPASINVPSTINGGQSITVSWAASSDAEGNLEGYELDRSVNGGTSWTNVYKGSGTSTANTVPFGTDTVMYRVRAYDSEGLYSGYRTSNQVTVVNNVAPTAPASITVPMTVLGGTDLVVSWGAAEDSDGNLAGYELERQYNGGEWEQIFHGNARSHTDHITKGWETVAYRVRAYDGLDVTGPYRTSDTRTVNNNTAPEITCDYSSGSDLGVKDAGFVVTYSVDDEDGDAVTVTEAIDGAVKRSFEATPEQEYSFQVTGETFMRLLNGKRTLTITADDGKAATVHTLTFEKKVTKATVTLDKPMEADGEITLAILSVIGNIPADADYKAEATNNGKDEKPEWQDVTAEVRSGSNIVFANHTAGNGFAFNFRITVERGESGQGGYITSVQGGFQ